MLKAFARILVITSGICFLSHPPRRGLRVVPCSSIAGEHTDGFPRSVCPFCMTLGRHSTPCPTYWVDPTYLLMRWANGDKFPFWACLYLLGISRLAGFPLRRLRAFVENPVHSHLLRALPLSASSLSLFHPCTPTIDNQSHAVG